MAIVAGMLTVDSGAPSAARSSLDGGAHLDAGNFLDSGFLDNDPAQPRGLSMGVRRAPGAGFSVHGHALSGEPNDGMNHPRRLHHCRTTVTALRIGPRSGRMLGRRRRAVSYGRGAWLYRHGFRRLGRSRLLRRSYPLRQRPCQEPVPSGFPAAVPMVAPAAAAACSVKLWPTRPVDATRTSEQRSERKRTHGMSPLGTMLRGG